MLTASTGVGYINFASTIGPGLLESYLSCSDFLSEMKPLCCGQVPENPECPLTCPYGLNPLNL
jgi:hypothetical protein